MTAARPDGPGRPPCYGTGYLGLALAVTPHPHPHRQVVRQCIDGCPDILGDNLAVIDDIAVLAALHEAAGHRFGRCQGVDEVFGEHHLQFL